MTTDPFGRTALEMAVRRARDEQEKMNRDLPRSQAIGMAVLFAFGVACYVLSLIFGWR